MEFWQINEEIYVWKKGFNNWMKAKDTELVSSHSCVWLFGRGASISCGLDWTVPDGWLSLDRDELIERIRMTLIKEMAKRSIDPSIYSNLISTLASKTSHGWKHLFITTNWDYLLQREIQQLKLTDLPEWLVDSHVFHLNGTVEELPNNSRRSPFLLETDSPSYRISTDEANMAIEKILWAQMFVVVGMSFDCEMDRTFLAFIGRHQDNLPIGNSKWIILNPDKVSLEGVAKKLTGLMPNATIITVQTSFEDWQKNYMPELAKENVITMT